VHRWLAAAGLAVLVVAVTVAVARGLRSGDETAATAPATTAAKASTEKKAAKAPAPAPVVVRLRGLKGFDPEGDGRERDDTAALATDGDVSTGWQTESYTSFFKDGVGLLLDAGKPVTLTRVVVTTDTPGVSAGIRIGTRPEGPFAPVTQVKKLGARTTFIPRPRKGRYVVVWIDEIPNGGSAGVDEVRAWRAGSTA
jgi:hypothetical protein